jgi:hypothetical protein
MTIATLSVINLKTGKALSLDLPLQLQQLADEVMASNRGISVHGT